MSELTKAFDRCKLALMQKKNSVFITTVLFSLKHSWNEDMPTAGVNCTELRMNPEFFMGLSAEERVFLLAHEAWHVAFNHMLRKGSRDPMIWNSAGDYVINYMLKDAGYTMPKMGLYDPKYKGMSTEEVYNDLVASNKSPENKMPDLDYTEEPTVEQMQQVEEVLVRAATQSKMAGEDPGDLPGGIKRALDALLDPKLPWNVLLQKYMQEYAKEDYSWQRPNRRYLPDFYLPSLYSESICNLTVAIDVSGSVSQKEFNAFLAEVNSIKTVLNPEETRIISFDTKITSDITLTNEQSVANIEITGGGGTKLAPVFTEVEKKKPTVLIVFSDLYCSSIKEDPGYDVIWVCCDNTNATVNFGRLIHYSTAGL